MKGWSRVGSGAGRRGRAEEFLSRAGAEAARYGSSPMVFVRELIQNARDSGATRVELRTGRDGGLEWVSCRDDGEGMRLEEAQRFLFTLYASSKGGRGSGQAGRFGVGFWSVLRFEPEAIEIRSRPRRGAAWQVRLDHGLRQVRQGHYDGPRGTEVVLERPARDADLGALVQAAAAADARFVTQRDRPAAPLEVVVDGRSVSQPFTLPAPSLGFRRPGLRGVVGLGPDASVELLSHGIRVRSAALLEELLSLDADQPGVRASGAGGVGGLMPQIVLDSDRLEVLLARGDAREDRELRRAVRLARRELARLLRRQLDRSAPLAWPVRLALWARRLGRRRRALVSAAVVLLASLTCAALLLAGGGRISPETGAPGPWPRSWPRSWPWLELLARGRAGAGVEAGGEPAVDAWAAPVARAAPVAGTRPFADLAAAYRGPAVSMLGQTPARFDLEYWPADLPLYLVAFRVFGLDHRGLPVVASTLADGLEPMAGPAGTGPGDTPCSPPWAGCMQVELVAAPGQRRLRLPVPTGYQVLPGSIRANGRPRWPSLTNAGEPVVQLGTAAAARVRYQVVPGPAAIRLPDRWPELPERLEVHVERLRAVAEPERVQMATHLVAGLVRYDTGERTAALLAGLGGEELLRRAVEVGAGDCDVQASLLAALLDRVGVPAHLAVGLLGRDGHVQPWLHAWVEYRGGDGRWAVADASSLGPAAAPGMWSTGSDPVDAPGSRGLGEGLPAAGDTALAERLSGPMRQHLALALGVGCGVVGLMAVLMVALLLARRMRRRERLERSADVPALLRGMLEQPGAYSGVAGIEHRPLVPTIGRRALSVHRCRALAARGRLLASSETTALARWAAAAGAPVVRAASAEGRVVAQALAAADVDRWHRALDCSRELPWAASLEAELSRRLGRVRVLGSRGLDQPFLIVNLGLGRRGASLLRKPVVLIDLEQPVGRVAAGLASTLPARAVHLLAELTTDELTRRLGLPRHPGAAVLETLASQALAEAGRSRS